MTVVCIGGPPNTFYQSAQTRVMFPHVCVRVRCSARAKDTNGAADDFEATSEAQQDEDTERNADDEDAHAKLQQFRTPKRKRVATEEDRPNHRRSFGETYTSNLGQRRGPSNLLASSLVETLRLWPAILCPSLDCVLLCYNGRRPLGMWAVGRIWAVLIPLSSPLVPHTFTILASALMPK